MSDKWDAYIVDEQPTDKWEAYVVQEKPKKTFWGALGSEITPEMWKQSPYLAAVGQTAQDIFATPAAFFNQFLLNQPRSILNTVGVSYPESQSVAGKVGAGIAGISGGITSPVAQALSQMGNVFKTAPLSVKVVGGALAGGSAGFSYAPTQNIFDMKQRTQQALLGAGLGGATSFVTSIAPKLINLGGQKTAQAIAEKADKGIDKLSQSLSDKYDDVLGNMKGSIKSQDVINDIQQTIDEFPEGANTGKLKSIIKRLKSSDDVSAKELFNIKKEIGKTIPKSVWNGVSNSDAITNSKEQLYWKLTEKLEVFGGDKYKGLTAEYKNFKQAERLARKMFYRRGVPSNAPLMGTYDIPTQRAIRSLNSQLSPEEQFANAFEAWRRGQVAKKDLGIAGGLGLAGYLAHRYIASKVLPKE